MATQISVLFCKNDCLHHLELLETSDAIIIFDGDKLLDNLDRKELDEIEEVSMITVMNTITGLGFRINCKLQIDLERGSVEDASIYTHRQDMIKIYK